MAVFPDSETPVVEVPPDEDTDRLLCPEQDQPRGGGEDKPVSPNLNSPLTPYEAWKDYLVALPSFVRGYVGSGLVALPYVFYEAGILWGLILTVLCCFSNHYLMKLIALTCDDCQVSKNGWGNMCGVVGGWKLQLAAEVSLLVSQLGTCIGETMFALKFLNYAFCGLSVESICDHNFKQIIMILIVIVPLTAVTNMRYLSLPNELADFTTLGFISVTIYLGYSQLGSFSAFFENFQQGILTFKIGGTIFFCGTLLYAIGGVGAILDVRNSMKSTQVFYSVLRSGFIVVGVTFGFFGAFNALVSLEETNEIYLYNLPITKLSLISQIVFLFTITMTYITNQFPVMTIVESWMDPKDRYFHADKTHGGFKVKFTRFFVRYLILAGIISVASFVPSFNMFLSFVGSYNFAVMNGLLPVITYNIRFTGRMTKFTKYLNISLLIMCLILGGVGMVQSIQEMLAGA